MIDDKELRDLFRTESAEHLQSLETGFLRLEKDPGNPEALEESFREAHSLKGAARMLGLADIERLSHRIEDVLGDANKGRIPLSPEALELLYRAADAVRRLVGEAVTGTPSKVNISEMVQQLRTISESAVEAAPLKGKRPQTRKRESVSPEFQKPLFPLADREPEIPGHEGGAPESEFAEFRIDTIRVDTRKLDELMTHAGELSATRLRIAQRQADVERVIAQWEAIARKMAGDGPAAGQPNGEPRPIPSDMQINELDLLLGALRTALDEDNSRLGLIADELTESIGKIRLLPFSTLFNLFPRMVRDIAKEKAKEVRLIMEGGETSADKRILEEMKDPLMHILRNAVDHGIEPPEEREKQNKPPVGTVRLRACRTPSHVVIEASDDGRGLDIESIKRAALKRKWVSQEALSAMTVPHIHSLIFAPGVSTSSFVSDISGRGIGLDVARVNVERLKGTIHVESQPSRGCTLRILLPLTVATSRVAIVTAHGVKYALPVEYIQTIRRIDRKELFTLAGRKSMVWDQRPVPVAHLSDILTLRQSGSPSQKPQQEAFPSVLLSAGDESLVILVDEIFDEQEIVLKPLSKILQRIRNISGSTILGTGETCMILNPHDLIKSARKSESATAEELPEGTVEAKKSLLVAEDSITVRTQMRRILEGAGYEVTVAVDGLDAFNKLGEKPYDALVSDIMMPHMDGLTLAEKIRQDKKYREMPVILVTSLASDDDRKKGIEAGANAYITKSSFDQRVLLETLRRLI